MVTVPSSYVSLVQEAASGTGLPYNVVAAQANEESGFNASATSSAGAEGWLQFEPGTYNAVAAQAGVPQGTEYNPSDETKAYIVYMNQLLQQEGGSIFRALEAYNAGPGNLGAGAGYANTIMAAAGTPTSATAGKPGTQQAQTTAATFSFPNPLGIIDPMLNLFGLGSAGTAVGQGISTLAGDILKGLGQSFLNAFGIQNLKDGAERLGLILMGFILVIVGIHIMTSSGSGQPIQITTTETPEETTTTRQVSGGGIRHRSTTTTVKGATQPPEKTHKAREAAGGIVGSAIEGAAAA